MRSKFEHGGLRRAATLIGNPSKSLTAPNPPYELPIPDSRFPIPDSRFPIPYSLYDHRL
ncbi:hypothetical protein [Moorena sp. SIO2C4]|uniref:hypothetical protein n=1 Tax=Moorena sp. SIO2C4 TaxID=2607824 RepID=UPI0013C1A89E|nr:hypothetical protein [Moorena sp. SIO2C4]NEQ13488.1 hypothetical protein [Moorena sp. SIO3E2]NES46412.1 hypothetical protein [Moorena sp. SIO2C4]